MKIAFKKITSSQKPFSLQNGDMVLSGYLKLIDSTIIKLEAALSGKIVLICDRSGEEFIKQHSESLVLYISDGLWDTQSQSKLDSFEVIEFFDGFIDLDSILLSEIESIKSDYHIKGE